MIRTLQLAGVHGWVSLRLTVSRSYWLERLPLSLCMGGLLLFWTNHFDPLSWGPVLVSFIIGLPCFFSSLRPETDSRNLALPLPQAWLTVVNTLAHLAVCAGVAIGFKMLSIAATYAIALKVERVEAINQPVEQMLNATELQSMAIMVGASIPFGIVVHLWGRHIQQPTNAWTNRRWSDVLPPMFGITAAFVGVLVGATALNAPVFVVKYLLVWLELAASITILATFVYGWTALFPPSETRVQTAKPAMQRLVATVWQSQALKWSCVLVGLALYLLNPGTLLPSEVWFRSIILGLRPVLVCYAALMPLMSMSVLTSFHSTSTTIRMSWKWRHSGWRVVPAPRTSIQRALLLDSIGFATASTLVIHIATLLFAQAATGNPGLDSWARDLSSFTWFFTTLTGMTLPVFVLSTIPRRRFGQGLLAIALATTFWSLRTAFFSLSSDIGWTLPLKQHLITIGCWMVLGAVAWGQTASPSGRLFEIGAPTSRWSRVVAGVIGARGSRWSMAAGATIAILATVAVHRNAVSSEIDRRNASRITAKQTDRLVRDLERIAELDILNTPTRTRDAGSLLNPHIGIDDGTPAADVPWWDDIQHKYLLKRPDSPWFDAPEDVVVGDLSILTKLTAFDHWETARLPAKDEPAVGMYEQHFESVRHDVYLNWGEPFPNLVALIDLAKFRLLHGLRTNDVLPALAEVRHLARLVYSDETFIHTILAVRILRVERRAYVAAVERGQLTSADWAEVSEDDLNRMHRVAVSMDYMMSGGAEEAHWRRIAELPFEPFGLCGGMHEAMTMAMSQPNISLWPGELFPQQNMGFVDHGLSTNNCSTPLARHDHGIYTDSRVDWTDSLFRNPEWHRVLSKEFDESTMLALTLPYLRGHAWMGIQESQNMNGILMYGETPEDDWNGVRSRRP